MNKKQKKLSISVVIPAYNEEQNLKRLFASLKKQTRQKRKIEYVYIDDASEDNSLKLARQFGARIIKVNTHDIELNKGIGMHAAKNDLVYWLDADMEVCSKDFFERMAQPMEENIDVIGSFTREFAMDVNKQVDNSLLRFISYDDYQRDPVYRFFSLPTESAFSEKRKDYTICKFIPGNMPPVGRVMFRRKELLKTAVGKDKSFIDMEATEIVARAGHQSFAFVPKAKMRHYHAESLRLLVKKRVRNLNRDYLPNIGNKYFTWIRIDEKKEVARIAFWIIWVNLFIPELLRGVFKVVRYKDIAFLWQPIVSIAVTDSIVWGFLSKPKGRRFATNLVTSLIK